MPVDFSRFGLEGIETGQRTLNAIANREALAVESEGQRLSNETLQRENELGMIASERMQQIANGTFSGESTLFKHDPNDASDAVPLEVLADTFMRGGAPKMGADYLKAASGIRKQENEIRNADITARKNIVETTLKTADLVAQTVGIAQNQSEWEWGLQQLEDAQALPPEALAEMKKMEYDPDVVTYINEQALSAKDRATMDFQSRQQDRLEEDSEFRKKNQTRLADIAQQRQNNADRIAKLKEKSGTDASAPNTNDVKAAEAAIKAHIFKGDSSTAAPEAIKTGAYAIAARAKALVRTNKALDWDTALSRAISESQSNGDWDTDKGYSIFGFPISDDTTKFVPKPGKTPDMPAPLPADKKLKKGMYYVTGKGTILWDGTKGVPVE